MPRKFTRNYAERLNEYSAIHVKEAAYGEQSAKPMILS
jgi:chemotaxis response regulator CheB